MAVVEHGAASIGKTNAAKTNAKIQANNAKAIGDALVALFAGKGTKARALKLKADNRGTRVTGSSVSAHRQRIARPGPGKGWRSSSSAGRPSWRPIARTSSL